MSKYTEEQANFLKEYTPGHHYKEILEEYNRVFPESPITLTKLRSYLKNYKIKTGFTGRFEKGNTPYTRGKKQVEFMDSEQIERSKKGRFKTGNIPRNHKPVGTISMRSSEGRTFIKIAEPNNWILYARYVWEQHNGAIPPGYKILHINGISTDDRIENLKLISKAELNALNKLRLSVKGNSDINEACLNLAKLKLKISKVKKGGSK